MNVNYLTEKYELNDLEIQIVNYMKGHFDQLKSIGIRQMAKDNFTSTTTIYKLCNKLGFEGYSDLIYHLTSTKNQLTKNQSNYTLHKKQFLSLIENKKIIVTGLGFCGPVAEYMHQRLTLKGYSSLAVVHLDMLCNTTHSDTVLIVVSHSGKTPSHIDFVNTAIKHSIPVISFVGQSHSPLYELSTLPIQIGKSDDFSYDLNQKHTFFGECIIAFEHLLFD